jgi:hypothetical protein
MLRVSPLRLRKEREDFGRDDKVEVMLGKQVSPLRYAPVEMTKLRCCGGFFAEGWAVGVAGVDGWALLV